MNLGIIRGEAMSDYHSSGAVGSHALGDFADSPLLFQRKYVTKEAAQPERSDAFAFGSYFHTAVLEGEKAVAERYAVQTEKYDRRTKDGKAAAAAFEAANAGKDVVALADVKLAEKMLAAVRAKKTCVELFAHGAPEVTMRHQVGPFAVQCRCDWFDDRLDEWKRPTIVDVKTVESIGAFEKQFLNYAYYRQAAFYRLVASEVLKLQGPEPRFIFVVVEKSEPFDVAIYQPDEIALETGRTECVALLKRLKACYLSGEWSGQPDSIQPLELPAWKTIKGEN